MDRNYRAYEDELEEDLNGWGVLCMLVILGMSIILYFVI